MMRLMRLLNRLIGENGLSAHVPPENQNSPNTTTRMQEQRNPQ